MLARLISVGQVTVLYDSTDVRLFYHVQVHSRSTESGFEELPQHLAADGVLSRMDVDRYGPGATYRSLLRYLAGPGVFSNPRSMEVMVSYGRSKPGPFCWGCLYGIEELMEWYVFSLLSIFAIHPGHVI